MRTAVITGITRQDGAYLSKLLLKKGSINGTYRRTFISKTGVRLC